MGGRYARACEDKQVVDTCLAIRKGSVLSHLRCKRRLLQPRPRSHARVAPPRTAPSLRLAGGWGGRRRARAGGGRCAAFFP